MGKLPSKYVLCSFSYNFQLQLPRCSQTVFRDCFNSESLSRENITLVDMNNVISRLCFFSLYFNPFFLENLKALIIINTNNTLSNTLRLFFLDRKQAVDQAGKAT